MPASTKRITSRPTPTSPRRPASAQPLPDWASLGALAPRVQKRLEAMQRQQLSRRFWQKDATLWKKNAAAVKAIRNRLGWLTAIKPMQAEVPSITGFADQVRAAGFTHALLLGMGGSSLCAEVFRQSFGVGDRKSVV